MGRTQNLSTVPGKLISAYPRLNITNRQINFIPWLHSVPKSTFKTNLGINLVLNLTQPVRMITLLIRGKSLSKQTKWWTYCSL